MIDRKKALDVVQQARVSAERWEQHQKVDMASIVKSLCRLVEKIVDRPKTVYLIWVNDMVTDVVETFELATAAAAEARKKYPGSWRHWPAEPILRWHQPDGPVARLEIEVRDVKGTP